MLLRLSANPVRPKRPPRVCVSIEAPVAAGSHRPDRGEARIRHLRSSLLRIRAGSGSESGFGGMSDLPGAGGAAAQSSRRSPSRPRHISAVFAAGDARSVERGAAASTTAWIVQAGDRLVAEPSMSTDAGSRSRRVLRCGYCSHRFRVMAAANRGSSALSPIWTSAPPVRFRSRTPAT